MSHFYQHFYLFQKYLTIPLKINFCFRKKVNYDSLGKNSSPCYESTERLTQQKHCTIELEMLILQKQTNLGEQDAMFPFLLPLDLCFSFPLSSLEIEIAREEHSADDVFF